MRISDWSSDVCSSDLRQARILDLPVEERLARAVREQLEQRPNLHPRPRCRQRQHLELRRLRIGRVHLAQRNRHRNRQRLDLADENTAFILLDRTNRSEEHTSELQSLMRISYAVFCLNKKNTHYTKTHTYTSVQ